MVYDQLLAQRIRERVSHLPGFQEKKMFGGIGFLIQGNMACGAHGADLIVRVGPEHFQEALDQPHTRIFDLTGKPMFGWVTVAPAGYETDQQLNDWIVHGVDFARSLPAK